MGLLASLYAAIFGTRRRPGERDAPSELTAVAPDFTGFVSNRPAEPNSGAGIAPENPDPVKPGAVADGAAARTAAPLPPDLTASELTALAPEFSGRVSNRPKDGDAAAATPPQEGRSGGALPPTG